MRVEGEEWNSKWITMINHKQEQQQLIKQKQEQQHGGKGILANTTIIHSNVTYL
jgi:cytochrome oxidase Cu insertion factor (SCO1/SenC/PrrC family)